MKIKIILDLWYLLVSEPKLSMPSFKKNTILRRLKTSEFILTRIILVKTSPFWKNSKTSSLPLQIHTYSSFTEGWKYSQFKKNATNTDRHWLAWTNNTRCIWNSLLKYVVIANVYIFNSQQLTFLNFGKNSISQFMSSIVKCINTSQM